MRFSIGITATYKFVLGRLVLRSLVLAGMLFAGTLSAEQVDNRRNFEGLWHGPSVASLLAVPPDVIPGANAPTNPAKGFPFNATGQQIMAKRREWAQQGKLTAGTHLTCRPNGVAILTPAMTAALMVQTPKLLVLISQGQGRELRQVLLNQAHPKKIVPSYMGHSVGRWEGDTLVVDTIGYNGRGTISALGVDAPGIDPPTSNQLHTVERWTKSADGNTINIVLRIEDPVYYTQPFTQTYTLERYAQRVRLMDYDCSENPREDDFAAWAFEDDWFKPVCVLPVRNGLAGDKVICTPLSKSANKE